jgi:hypothetical protein
MGEYAHMYVYIVLVINKFRRLLYQVRYTYLFCWNSTTIRQVLSVPKSLLKKWALSFFSIITHE